MTDTMSPKEEFEYGRGLGELHALTVFISPDLTPYLAHRPFRDGYRTGYATVANQGVIIDTTARERGETRISNTRDPLHVGPGHP